MDIQFTGHGIDLSANLKQFTTEKFSLLNHHIKNILSIHVTFSIEKLNHMVEATVHVTQDTVHASASSENIHTAIEEVVHKLDRQLIKHKEKIQSHRDHRD